jgi:hypothetical protein
MMNMSRPVDPEFSLPIQRIHVMIAWSTFCHKSTLTSSPYEMILFLGIENFPYFVSEIDAALRKPMGGNCTDRSIFATAFILTALLGQVVIRDHRFPVTWNRHIILKLTANLHDAIFSGRNDAEIPHLTRSLRGPRGSRRAEVHESSDSAGNVQSATGGHSGREQDHDRRSK